MLTFHIEGDPVPKGRPKFRKAGAFVRTYTPGKTVDYENTVREAAKQAMGVTEALETPIGLFLYMRLPIPASYSKKAREACIKGEKHPTKKPDIDNLAKSIIDGMNGVIYKDDGQIVSLHVKKVYASCSGVDVLVKEELQ
jgi:Holliday junction resolvase RusA-like endonuclease